ncbi:MFS transporter [Thermotoga neapolitana]|uniref:MFS transporter n=1 Tax=Thermotoga neapolitana TaxID=2337 RepID=UPI000ADA3148|nr:MFS transporter [Thermotoga neapolitana]
MKNTYLFLTLEGIFSLFYSLLVQGPVFTGLAMLFNLDEFLLSIAAAVPPMMQFFQLFASFFVRKYRKRRFLVNVFNALSRFSFAALVVFILLGKTDPIVFIASLMISQIFAALSSSTWNSWMRDLIPPEERGRVFGNRNMFLSIGNAS